MSRFSLRKVTVAAALLTLPIALVSCGEGPGGDSASSSGCPAPTSTPEAGGGLTTAASDPQITIGTKFDQPGLGIKNPDGTMTGFDVDVAAYIAQQMGFSPEQIEWKESPSAQRETLIENDQVDFIVATYSITDARKEKIDFAGPYLLTGQSILVCANNTDITGKADLANNKRLCSVTGSTPAQKIKDEFDSVQLQEYDTYSACITALQSGAVDAVTTDEVILAGFAAQYPGAFKIVGEPFSEERYGIGLKKGDTALQTQINDALEAMEADGAWATAFEENLGPAGVATPEPPAIDPVG